MKSCPKCKEPLKGNAKFCPSCGEKLGRQSAEDKKSRLTEDKKGGKAPYFIVGALVLAGAVAFGVMTARNGSTSISASGSVSSDELTFSVTEFQSGVAKYYNYKAASGKDIKFFVLRSSDGVIRAAFDSCDVCYAAKKGYRQESDFMVCNNCGQRFTSMRINEVRGGCNPAPLERKIVGENLVIAVADILTGARYF